MPRQAIGSEGDRVARFIRTRQRQAFVRHHPLVRTLETTQTDGRMNLEDAGEVIIEFFPERRNEDRLKVAREFFDKYPDYWGYMSKTMEAFRVALARMPREKR
jgi:hypothetical protein